MDKGLITPPKAFEIPILKVLIKLKGNAVPKEVLKQLEKEVRLLDGDWQSMESGVIRWHNNANWAKYRLVKKGELDSPRHGIWRVTEKGRKRCEQEGPFYDQNKYKPIIPRPYKPKGGLRKQKLIDPSLVTTDFLQRWGVKQGLDLFELGLEGVKRKYIEYYRKKKGLEDEHLLKIIKRTMKEIKTFLNGDSSTTPTPEKLCQWVDYCYLFEMYWEGTVLFNKVPEDSISKELYRRTKKIADACQNNL
ncbi:MAG: winged helix-turn-helix domain-containing protein [bacterium]